jgi:hydroxyacylglutathione hydrolase
MKREPPNILWFDADAVRAAEAAGVTLQKLGEVTVAEARELLEGDGGMLDVRGAGEWQAGHMPDVANIPLGYLRDHIDELPAGRPLVLHCETGSRSGIAASLLAQHGIRDVVNLRGGIKAWETEGHPVEREEPVAATG